MARPEKTVFDPAIIAEALGAFDKLIAKTIAEGKGDKYDLTLKLASQAGKLASLARSVSLRVADHMPVVPAFNMGGGVVTNYKDGDMDETNEPVYDDDYLQRAGPPLRQLPQADLLREMVSMLGPLTGVLVDKEKTATRNVISSELVNVMEAREKLLAATAMDSTEKDALLGKIDSRMRLLVSRYSAPEESNGAVVVPAKLLRGHQPDGRLEGQGPEDKTVMGTAVIE
jgi:hypothetical protein